MDDEKLIEIVRNYELLYNLKHPKYMDNIKKEIAWKEIGERLKQSAVACKQRWQCLRDAYRRALNKKKGKSGYAAKNMKQWKYENEMAFLAPYFVERKSQNSIDNTSDDELFDNTYDNLTLEFNASEKANADIDIDDSPANVSVGDSFRILNEDTQNESQKKIFAKKTKLLKRKTSRLEPTPSAILMTKLLDDINQLEPPRGYDDLDRFFLNVSDTVKKFSPYQQALAKNKIFSLVSEMELQQLAPPSSPPYAFNMFPPSASSSATALQIRPDKRHD